MTSASVEDAVDQLDNWISSNGWAGYDPYDIRGQDWFVRLFGYQTWFHQKLRGLLWLVEENLPPAGLRKVLRISKAVNAKGMGLLASAYLSLYSTNGRREYLGKAESILAWLAANSSHGYPGISWGYPFHWQSRVMIPRGTPSGVVTGVVGNAWLDHFVLTGSQASLSVAHRIAEFFLRGLNQYKKAADQLCFSYTPIDDFKVHNANLFVAAFLARFGEVTNNHQCLDVAVKSVRYTLSEQNADGSFFYWSSEPPSIIDHYHTGFVLRHLDTIQRATGCALIAEPLRKGYRFYLDELFTHESVPKFTRESLYPIDIHSCAEAILCLCQLGPIFGGVEKIDKVLTFTLANLRSPSGYYIARIRRHGAHEQKLEIAYMRWAQAWMLLALARMHAMQKRTAGGRT